MLMKFKGFFSRLDNRIRHNLSHHPVIYALIGGFGIVIFWSGVERWIGDLDFMTPLVSIVFSVIAMLATGTLVSFFVGEQVLLTGLTEEKRIDQKTEQEVREEETRLKRIISEIDEIRKIVDGMDGLKRDISEIKQKLSEKNPLV